MNTIFPAENGAFGVLQQYLYSLTCLTLIFWCADEFQIHEFHSNFRYQDDQLKGLLIKQCPCVTQCILKYSELASYGIAGSFLFLLAPWFVLL